MDLDTFRWLLTDAGQELLGQATEAPQEELKAQAQLRQVAPGSDEERAARVAAAIGQVTLRRKAAAKFGDDGSTGRWAIVGGGGGFEDLSGSGSLVGTPAPGGITDVYDGTLRP